MAKPLIAVLWFAALAVPALGAVNKDGGQPSVNPCLEAPASCNASAAPQQEQAATEPMVIFLDAEGNTLVRLPLSKFRKAVPDAKLPPQLEEKR